MVTTTAGGGGDGGGDGGIPTIIHVLYMTRFKKGRLRRRKLDTSGRPRIAGKRHGQASQPGISVARLDDDGVVARAPTPHSAQRHKQVPRSQGEIAHKGGAQMDDAIFAIGEDFPGIAQQRPEIILLC